MDVCLATSKYPPPLSESSRTFGFRGQALSSLATHSLFTLTSRHHAHRSTHTVRISYSVPVFTGFAPEHLRLPATGTVVRVEGLWGDMPVRLKARQQDDIEREWEDINRTLVQLLLTPQGKGVAMIARDENGNRKLVVKDGNRGPWEMGVLRQVYGREVAEGGWEKVKAQQGGVGIEGWICTRGSGTRGLQFLYINNHPLPPSTTLLHAEINRIFAASSFGVIDEDEAKAMGSKSRGGPRKGVEKWGMFILHIGCNDGDVSMLGGEGGTAGKAGLEGDYLNGVINLLQKLLREFLKTHHFRPFSISPNTQEKDPETRKKEPPTIVDFVQRRVTRSRSRSSTPLSTITNSSNLASGSPSREGTPQGNMRALARWSRVKSAKADLNEEEGRQRTGFKVKEFTFSSTLPLRNTENIRASPEATAASLLEKEGSTDKDGDEYVAWTNPVSEMSFQVNTRTGNTTTIKPPSSGPVQPPSDLRVKRSASTLSLLERELSENPENSPTKKPRKDESGAIASKGAFVEQLLKVRLPD